MLQCFDCLTRTLCLFAVLTAQAPIPQNLLKYIGARTVVDRSPSELIAAFPELKGLEFMQSQDGLSSLLARVGDRVQALFHDFPNTSSLERVCLERLGDRGEVVARVNREFQYLLIMRGGERGNAIEEDRTDTKGRQVNLEEIKRYHLLSGGYSSIPMYFHPSFRTDSIFRYLGKERTGRIAHVIAFAQRPEAARLIGTFLSLQNPLRFFVQGIAWIDPANYQIVRMRTELLNPVADLQRNTAEIQLEEIHVGQESRVLWLPHEVVVTTQWMGRVFRNRHRYSDYRLFTVETREDQKRVIKP